MSGGRQPGFLRERARGVGYLVLLGAAILTTAAAIAGLTLVALR